MGFWIFGFFCVLHLCFQSVEAAPKLDSEKNGVCIGIYSAFKGCVHVVGGGGGDHIYVYIYTGARFLKTAKMLGIASPKPVPAM